MAKNLRILHDGMGFPKLEVISRKDFPSDPAGHISLGAVEETDHPVTHGREPLPEIPKEMVEANAQNIQMRQRVAELEGRVAGLLNEKADTQKEIDRLTAEGVVSEQRIEKLSAENREIKDLLDQATRTPERPVIGRQ